MRLSSSHGGRRKLPYAFTENGAIMAANVLNSPEAVRMSVFVVRAFVQMRDLLGGTKELAQQLAALEKKLTARLDGMKRHRGSAAARHGNSRPAAAAARTAKAADWFSR